MCFLRRLHSAFEKHFFTFVGEKCCKAKQGAEEGAEEGAAERTGEDLCHPSGYNKETARAVSLNIAPNCPWNCWCHLFKSIPGILVKEKETMELSQTIAFDVSEKTKYVFQSGITPKVKIAL